VILPGHGAKLFGSSALMRISIAWPRGLRSPCERQLLAGGDPQLLAHQVEAGDQLGHRVLDLQPRVHLHEVEAAVLVEQELERADVVVADRRIALTAALVSSARTLLGAAPTTAPPRSPSGGGAGSSTRARRGARSCRGLSAITWISMWRGRSQYRSMYMSGLPNAASASVRPVFHASSELRSGS
jgi:hypothetical protein